MEEQESSEARYLELIPKLRLMDDDFLKACMQDNKPGVQLILRIVLRNKGLVVTRVVTQKEMKNLVGHSLELDVYAEDEEGRHINAEIQRKDMPGRCRNGLCITVACWMQTVCLLGRKTSRRRLKPT